MLVGGIPAVLALRWRWRLPPFTMSRGLLVSPPLSRQDFVQRPGVQHRRCCNVKCGLALAVINTSAWSLAPLLLSAEQGRLRILHLRL